MFVYHGFVLTEKVSLLPARLESDDLASDSSTRRSIIVFHLSYNSDDLSEISLFSEKEDIESYTNGTF